MHRLRFLVAALLCLGVVGCLEGPLKLGRYNPIYREEWKKDQQYGPSMHDKLEELVALRAAATRLSAAEQQKKSAELLQYFQNERNPTLASAMVRTIAAFPTPESSEALRLASNHSDPDVRVAACDGWGRKGGAEALETLARMLGSDTDADVRIAAARDLENFRDPGAVQALGLALESNDPALQFRAVSSLKRVTGKDYGDSVPAWREYVQSGQVKPADAPSFAERFRSWF